MKHLWTCTFVSTVAWFSLIVAYLVFEASGDSEGAHKLSLNLLFGFPVLFIAFPVVWVGSLVLLGIANAITSGRPGAFVGTSALEGALIGIFVLDYHMRFAPFGGILVSIVMISAAGVTIYFNRDESISSVKQESLNEVSEVETSKRKNNTQVES